MNPINRAFDGIFIPVNAVSPDLLKHFGKPPAYLEQHPHATYLNVFRYCNDVEWSCVVTPIDGAAISKEGLPLAKDTQEVLAFILECNLEI